MKKEFEIGIDPKMVDYLVARVKADDDFLADRQNALKTDNKEEDVATMQYLQGKRDMCKQFLLYLEEMDRSPRVEIAAKSADAATSAYSVAWPTPKLFHYPDDYDRNE